MALNSGTSLTHQHTYGVDDCKNHLQKMTLHCTSQDNRDICDDCRRAFQNLTLQTVTQHPNMADLGDHGTENVKSSAEAEAELEWEDQEWASYPEGPEFKIGDLALLMADEHFRQFYENAENNRVQTEDSEDEKSIYETEDVPVTSIPVEKILWLLPLPCDADR